MASRPLPLAGGSGVRRASQGARLVTLLAVAALAGCGGGAPTSHHGPNGSLHGTVTRGPTKPVCRAGTPCSQPASGVRIIFQQQGHAVTSAVVAKDGSYSVSLAPGIYVVAVSPEPQVGNGINPRTVRVSSGQAGKVDFQIDTGMR